MPTIAIVVVVIALFLGGLVFLLSRKKAPLPTLPDDGTADELPPARPKSQPPRAAASVRKPKATSPHKEDSRRIAEDVRDEQRPSEKQPKGKSPGKATAKQQSQQRDAATPGAASDLHSPSVGVDTGAERVVPVAAERSAKVSTDRERAEEEHADEERAEEEHADEERAEEEFPDSTIPISVEVDSAPMAPPRRHTRDVAGLRQGLSKMRGAGGFFGRLKELFVGKAELAPNIIEQLEEVLLTSDVGVKTTALLLEDVRLALKKKDLASSERVWERLRERATELLEVSGGGPLRARARPTVVLIVGVNGTGKTTTIGKLATKLTEQGKTVLLVAGDTFRAAAVQQLQAWGKRVGCAVHAGADGADPASVTFEAIARAMREKPDFVLIDTAGRLHTKSNLMDELRKIERTAAKGMPGAPHETLLVVDGTTGQNALQQVAEFGAALPLTGLVLTKLDGTAKGGCVLAIASEHNVPVRYIGLGERAQDLREFDAGEFVEALLGHGDDSARAA